MTTIELTLLEILLLEKAISGRIRYLNDALDRLKKIHPWVSGEGIRGEIEKLENIKSKLLNL